MDARAGARHLRHMTMKRVLCAILPATALAACTMGPDYRPASPAALGVPASYSVAADERAQENLSRWWTRFNDPLLTRLVEQARTDNLDIAQAIARLRQAHEGLIQSRAQLLPQVSGSGGYSRSFDLTGASTITLPDGTITTISRGSNDSFSLGADVSYQIGLFGEVRRTVEASRAQYEGAGYDTATVLISTEAEIARNYVLARLYQAQLANARASLAIQDDNLEIAGFRVQAGLVSSLDQEQARASRAQTAASIPSIEESYNQAVSRLGVLTGQAPGALKAQMEAIKPIPIGPANVAVGIPAETLRQRPDVRAAERQLAAATARIGVAEAQLYPALSIGGSIDSGSSALSSLFDVITGRLFSNIAQTIFDGGTRQSQVRSARAAADGAFLAYKSAVLTSLEDIENAIVALQTAQRREQEFTVALDAANNQAVLARLQYRSGLTDFTTLNTAESSLLSARNGLSQARSDKATALVQLYLALGGGWDSASVPTIADTPAVIPAATSPSEDR